MFVMHSVLRISILACSIGLPIAAHAQGFDTTKIDQVFGRTGQKMGDIYRFGFPRTDLHVVIDGTALKPGLALRLLGGVQRNRRQSDGDG
jgi:hypothetical protein